jgi:hypothetical protein
MGGEGASCLLADKFNRIAESEKMANPAQLGDIIIYKTIPLTILGSNSSPS